MCTGQYFNVVAGQHGAYMFNIFISCWVDKSLTMCHIEEDDHSRSKGVKKCNIFRY